MIQKKIQIIENIDFQSIELKKFLETVNFKSSIQNLEFEQQMCWIERKNDNFEKEKNIIEEYQYQVNKYIRQIQLTVYRIPQIFQNKHQMNISLLIKVCTIDQVIQMYKIKQLCDFKDICDKQQILKDIISDCNSINLILQEINNNELISVDFSKNLQRLNYLKSFVQNLNSIKSMYINQDQKFELSDSIQNTINEVINISFSKFIKYLNQNMEKLDKHMFDQSIQILKINEDQLLRFLKLFINFRSQKILYQIHQINQQTKLKDQEFINFLIENFFNIIQKEFSFIDIDYKIKFDLSLLFKQSSELIQELLKKNIENQNSIQTLCYSASYIDHFDQKVQLQFNMEFNGISEFQKFCKNKIKILIQQISQQFVVQKYNLKLSYCFNAIQQYIIQIVSIMNIQKLQSYDANSFYYNFNPNFCINPEILLKPLNELYQTKMEKENNIQIYIFGLNLDTIMLKNLEQFDFFREQILLIKERNQKIQQNLLWCIVQNRIAVQQLQKQTNYIQFEKDIQQYYLSQIQNHIINTIADVELLESQLLQNEIYEQILQKYFQFHDVISLIQEIIQKFHQLYQLSEEQNVKEYLIQKQISNIDLILNKNMFQEIFDKIKANDREITNYFQKN